MVGTRGASETDDDGAGLGRIWLLDIASAACWTAVVAGLLVAQGGIWEYVNSGDLHAQFVPWYEHSARSLLREGRLSLWTPFFYCGSPILALGQAAGLYPPVILSFILLPLWGALQALYASHVFLLTLGMTAYLRRHGIGRFAAGLAALLAVAVLFRGPMLAAVDHPQFLGCTVWIPWVLLCWEHAIRTHMRRGIAGFALAAAAQWCAGYPDFGLDLPVVVGVMALVWDHGSLRRRLCALVGGLALGAALAAVQILPIADAVAESPRVHPVIPHEQLRSVFAVHSPAHLGNLATSRFGPAALALAVLGVGFGFGLGLSLRTRLAWLGALVWSTFALDLPFRLLYLLPPYSGIRFPFGWSGASGVFLGILAAAGLTAAWRRPGRWPRILAMLLGAGALAHGLVVVARAPGSIPPFHPRGPSWRAPDLGIARMRASILEALVADHSRILSERESNSGSPLRYGLPIVNGDWGSVPPRRILRLLEELDSHYVQLGVYRGLGWPGLAARPDVGALLGIGLVVVPQRKADPLLAAGFTRVGALPPDDVVLHRPALPRARLVHRVIEAVGEEGTFDAVLTTAPEAPSVAVLEAGALTLPLEEPGPRALEETRIVRYEPEQVDVEALVATPALLVLTDTYYSGWRATVDGAPAPILRTDHAFRGVRLEPGRHLVIFRYAPVSVRLGALVSLLALIVVVLFLAWPRTRLNGSAAVHP